MYGWSQNRHGVFGVTYSTDNSDAGVYATNNGTGVAIYSDGEIYVASEGIFVAGGDLHAQGAFKGDVGNGGAPFPRPAFDSGWIDAEAGASFTLGVGLHLPSATYNNDNFVVDLMSREMLGHPGSKSVGIWDESGATYSKGVFYMIQPNNDITVRIGDSDYFITQVRVRVWYYR